MKLGSELLVSLILLVEEKEIQSNLLDGETYLHDLRTIDGWGSAQV